MSSWDIDTIQTSLAGGQSKNVRFWSNVKGVWLVDLRGFHHAMQIRQYHFVSTQNGTAELMARLVGLIQVFDFIDLWEF